MPRLITQDVGLTAEVDPDIFRVRQPQSGTIPQHWLVSRVASVAEMGTDI